MKRPSIDDESRAAAVRAGGRRAALSGVDMRVSFFQVEVGRPGQLHAACDELALQVGDAGAVDRDLARPAPRGDRARGEMSGGFADVPLDRDAGESSRW